MIPLVLASGWHLLTAQELQPGPAGLFVLATIVFAGSHNVSLLLGVAIVVPALAWLCLVCGRPRQTFARRRLSKVSWLLVLAVGVDAWILVPDVFSASRTQIAGGPLYPWSLSGFFNTPGVLFDPLRRVPGASNTPALFVQAPDWFLCWAMVSVGALWTRTTAVLRRSAAALLSILGLLLTVVMVGPVWDSLPALVRQVQYPYRLNTLSRSASLRWRWLPGCSSRAPPGHAGPPGCAGV